MRRSSGRGKDKKKSIRLPLPRKAGHPHSTPKGGKGYNRKKEREDVEQDKET